MKKLIIILAAIAMVGVFTTAAMADAELYGSARFRTYYISNDPGHPANVETKKDLEWRIGHLTRFGVNFKNGNMTGKFEMDARAGSGGATDNIDDGTGASGLGNMRLRQLWGQYDFGTFKLMIGQNFPLYDRPVSNIAYFSGGLQAQGGMGYAVARTSQIRVTVGDLKIAFLPPDTHEDGLGAYSQVNTTFPKLEVRYDAKMAPFNISVDGGWESYEIENPTTRNTENINSYVLGFRGKANFGPGYAGLGLTYRQNGSNYGAWTASEKETAVFAPGTHDVKNAKAWGVVAALGWKVNDMFTVEGNYAKLHSDQDTALDNKDDNQVWAVLAQVHLAPGFMVQPEFIYNDREDVVNDGVTTDQGNETIFGVWWIMNFK